MRVLVACEFSGTVRDAFRARGHDAVSCDLLPSEQPGPHIQGDVLRVLDQGWDLMVAHPPCQYLSLAGARWFKTDPSRWDKARAAYEFVLKLWNAPIPMIAIENTRGMLSSWWRKSDQVIHPYYFGDPMTKQTHLWLKNLPPLMASVVVANPVVNWTKYNVHTAKRRSKTFPGIARAMADQWGRAARAAVTRSAALRDA